MLAKPLKNLNRNSQEQTLDDATLWLSFKKGNELAFSVLYNTYVQRLYNYGYHACKDKELVNDCIQELFVLLWERRNRLADVTSVNFYLFKSYRRLLMNRLTLRRKLLISLSDMKDPGFAFIPSLEESIIAEESETDRTKKINKSLKALTKRQREAIFLRFYNQLSYNEVASVMELTVDSVYNIISKAIEVLRKNLQDTLFLAVILLFP
jgi:RNA polymerase sigma factor (sigma-70 family)